MKLSISSGGLIAGGIGVSAVSPFIPGKELHFENGGLIAKTPTPSFTPVTDGLPLRIELFAEQQTNEISAQTQVCWRFGYTHASDNIGIIFEAGATGSGMVCYVYQNVLYFQGGSGAANRVIGTNAMEAAYTITPGYYLIEGAARKNPNICRLYANGVQVAEGTATNISGNISGSDAGGILRNYNGTASNRMPTSTTPFSGSGSVEEPVRFYNGLPAGM